MKVLVIQQKMIGDVLTSTVLFEALRLRYPNASLHYLINASTLPVVENNPFIDEKVVLFPDVEKDTRKFYRFLQMIKARKYDVVIDCYGKISSLMIIYFSKAKIRIGYWKKYSFYFYTHPIARAKKSTLEAGLAIENRMKLLSPLGVAFQNLTPKIFLSSEEKQEARSFLEQKGINLSKPVFMISVLGSTPEKTYPALFMASLLDELVKVRPDACLLFNYIPKQREEAENIYKNCLPETRENIKFEVFAPDLRRFIAVTSHCDAILGNEGGAINIAKALEVPSFAIFSPYIPKGNWFGNREKDTHMAVHLTDYLSIPEKEYKEMKKNPQVYYERFSPEFILPELKRFLAKVER